MLRGLPCLCSPVPALLWRPGILCGACAMPRYGALGCLSPYPTVANLRKPSRCYPRSRRAWRRLPCLTDAVYRREACATDLGCYNGHRINLVRVPAKSPSHHTAPRNAGLCVCGDCTPTPAAVNPTNGIIKLLDDLRLAVHDRRHEHHMATTHQDLRDSGMPMCVIARRCDLSPQAVTDIGSGRTAEPKGSRRSRCTRCMRVACARKKAA